MGKLAAWLPDVLEHLAWGCSTSVILRNFGEKHGLSSAQAICLDLWPAVQELPQNIASVAKKVPENMVATGRLLQQFADEERFYQQLFLKQCELLRVSKSDLLECSRSKQAFNLQSNMNKFCNQNDYLDGVLSILTAELAATAFSRTAFPLCETFFIEHMANYESDIVEDGMQWLKLHAKNQTANALLLNRSLAELPNAKCEVVPHTAQVVLKAILEIWRCPITDTTFDTNIRKVAAF